jgi:hypothetical protein
MPGRRPARRCTIGLGLALGLVSGAALVGATQRPAEARLIDLHAGARAGGIVGWGTTPGTPDFFDSSRGGAFGAEVGVKVLVLDLSASFFQVVNSHGRVGTLSQALLGFEIDVPMGNAQTADGRPKLILRPGLGSGVAFGTPGPVHAPLSNDQISHKGLVSQAKLALEYSPHPLFGFGVEGDFGYHYFIGGGAAALSPGMTSISDHSSGYHLLGLATVTFHLGY